MNTAAMMQLSTPDARRPIASEIHEQKKRPATAEMLTQIASCDASAGVTCSTITNNVTIHNVKPTPPVCVSPVRQPVMRLRGYLNSSSQRVCSGTGTVSGRVMERSEEH